MTNIGSRLKARRSQRGRLHNWSFGQLRQFVAYKARLAGVLVLDVDPRPHEQSLLVMWVHR
jgi:IS605 OrfB family transposase